MKKAPGFKSDQNLEHDQNLTSYQDIPFPKNENSAIANRLILLAESARIKDWSTCSTQ